MVNIGQEYVHFDDNENRGNGRRFQLSSLFPSKDDIRHPPLWFSRALFWIVIAFFVACFIYTSFFKLLDVLTVIIIALFLAIALEPAVIFFEKHGVNRKIATLGCISTGLAGIIASLILFGSIFIEQLVSLISTLPDIYNNLRNWLSDYAGFEMPSNTDVIRQVLSQYANEIGAGTISVTFSALTTILNLLTIVLIMYYLCASGNEFRASLISWFPQSRQNQMIRVLAIAQTKVGGFLGSRLILALISIIFVSSVCFYMNIPYWLALGVFMGIVGQFIPTIGVYIGGALPVLVAFASKSPIEAVILLIILVVYQNIENIFLMPKISEDALDLNPAVAFLSVIAFGYVFGPIGAFLALPVTATFITVFRLVITRYDIIDIEHVQQQQVQELKNYRKNKEVKSN